MKLICYQDEKMYGPPPEDITLEELKEKIRKLEIELYGHEIEDCDEPVDRPQTIYCIDEGIEVDYEEFIKTERGKKFLEETEKSLHEEGFI